MNNYYGRTYTVYVIAMHSKFIASLSYIGQLS